MGSPWYPQSRCSSFTPLCASILACQYDSFLTNTEEMVVSYLTVTSVNNFCSYEAFSCLFGALDKNKSITQQIFSITSGINNAASHRGVFFQQEHIFSEALLFISTFSIAPFITSKYFLSLRIAWDTTSAVLANSFEC